MKPSISESTRTRPVAERRGQRSAAAKRDGRDMALDANFAAKYLIESNLKRDAHALNNAPPSVTEKATQSSAAIVNSR